MRRSSMLCIFLCLTACLEQPNEHIDESNTPGQQDMSSLDMIVVQDMRVDEGSQEDMGQHEPDAMSPAGNEDMADMPVEVDMSQDMLAEDLGAIEEDTSFLGGRVTLPGVLTVAPLRRGEVPEGMVGVAVGVGHGRIVMLCDQGRVVAHDEVYAPGASDHHPYSAKGLTFGNGIFLHSTGHGAPGFLLRSTDGVNWEQLSGDRFHYADGSTGDLEGGTATVYFAEDRFVLSLGSRRMISTDGLDWYEEGEALERVFFHFRTNSYVREVGTHFQAGTNSSKDMNWLIRSDDQGTSYRVLEGVTCNAPSTFGHGALLATARLDGDPCISLDGGETWDTFAPNLEESQGDYMAVDDGFVAFRGQRRTFYHSTDLVNWTPHEIRALRYGSAARSPEGYYVMTSRQNAEFYRSDDGLNWEVVESGAQGVTAIKRWTFGYIPPSEACPASN